VRVHGATAAGFRLRRVPVTRSVALLHPDGAAMMGGAVVVTSRRVAFEFSDVSPLCDITPCLQSAQHQTSKDPRPAGQGLLDGRRLPWPPSPTKRAGNLLRPVVLTLTSGLRSRLPLACELLRFGYLRWSHPPFGHL
jgi:hypothetical protein